MVAEYEIIKTEKEKLEKENSKLKEEIAEMIRVNESIFESGSKLDIRPEDLPNRFSKFFPVITSGPDFRLEHLSYMIYGMIYYDFSNTEGETEGEIR